MLHFDASVNINVSEECEIIFGVSNDGEDPFPGDNTFDTTMKMTQADLSERIFQASWQTRLPPGENRVIWGAPGFRYFGGDFSLLEFDDRLYLGEVSSSPLPDGDPHVGVEPSAPIHGLTGLSRQG